MPVVIENPILNGPFREPDRHFRFDDEGITDEIVAGRRRSEYFMPIPAAKKKAGTQPELHIEEWTKDRIEENQFINEVREQVGRWRAGNWPHVTGVTRRSAWLGDALNISDDGRTSAEAGLGSPGAAAILVYDWKLPVKLPWSW